MSRGARSSSPSSSLQGPGNTASSVASTMPVTSASTPSVSISASKIMKDQYLWEMTVEEIREWLHGTHPLFPHQNKGAY